MTTACDRFVMKSNASVRKNEVESGNAMDQRSESNRLSAYLRALSNGAKDEHTVGPNPLPGVALLRRKGVGVADNAWGGFSANPFALHDRTMRLRNRRIGLW